MNSDRKTYYRAVMPERAWKDGREPKWWRTRRRAVDDLIGGLDRYIKAVVDEQPYALATVVGVRSPMVVAGVTVTPASWVTWAARIADPHMRYGLGPAPDNSVWDIAKRKEWS